MCNPPRPGIEPVTYTGRRTPNHGTTREVHFLHLSVLFRPSKEWMVPSHPGESGFSLLSLLIQILVFFLEIHSDTSRSHVVLAIWASLHPTKLMLNMNHHKGGVRRLAGVTIQNDVSFIRSHLFIFAFISNILGGGS